MQKKVIEEGKIKLEVQDPESFRAPAGDYVPSLAEVFYNPKMAPCRDISVAVAQVISKKIGSLKVCDPLAGVGVRGLRYAAEVSGVSEVLLNDHSEIARELILRNLELNGLRAEVHGEDANSLLWKNRGRFNLLDLDPFGSPAPFLDAAFAALQRRALLAVTATDTAPLCGVHPKACVRRYGALPLKTEYCRELGIRILIGFTQRVAGKHEFAIRPLLSHATDHYFRVYFYAERGARRADEAMENLGRISHCFACGRRYIFPGLAPNLSSKCFCGKTLSHAGPLWSAEIGDRAFIGEVVKELAKRNFPPASLEINLLNRLMEEASGPPTFYDVNRLAKILRVRSPKIEKLLEAIRAAGFFASRTHFSPTGFRTNASYEVITRAF
ncbi:MAG: tRNA (guanine(10)-N(2))-dimethyltransferase [Candidatus Hadarchaeales archaeon]